MQGSSNDKKLQEELAYIRNVLEYKEYHSFSEIQITLIVVCGLLLLALTTIATFVPSVVEKVPLLVQLLSLKVWGQTLHYILQIIGMLCLLLWPLHKVYTRPHIRRLRARLRALEIKWRKRQQDLYERAIKYEPKLKEHKATYATEPGSINEEMILIKQTSKAPFCSTILQQDNSKAQVRKDFSSKNDGIIKEQLCIQLQKMLDDKGLSEVHGDIRVVLSKAKLHTKSHGALDILLSIFRSRQHDFNVIQKYSLYAMVQDIKDMLEKITHKRGQIVKEFNKIDCILFPVNNEYLVNNTVGTQDNNS